MIDTKEIINVLPQNIKDVIKRLESLNGLQEIRIKVNKPLICQIQDREIISDYINTAEDIKVIMQRISNYSIYAFEEEIKQGYITIKGGHRVGICGRCVIEKDSIKTIKNISSINFRISREVVGCSIKLMPFIVHNNRILNTIIISPPKCGKTTLLRDMARNISDGIESAYLKGKKVCIVDERSEIAACLEGIPQMNVGIRTDVLDSCLKSEGIMMAIRSMSPDVVLCDEIGTQKDMLSIMTAINCGISLLTSIHGNGIEDLFERVVFKELMDNKIFDRAIVLSNKKGICTVDYVYDFKKKDYIWRNEL
jgi:stage III sporulation protein AA